MIEDYINENKELYHKALGTVKLDKITKDFIYYSTKKHGVLPFFYFDIGKVLFLNSEHAKRYFSNSEEYLEFCEDEIKKEIIRIQVEKQIDEEKRIAKVEKEKRLLIALAEEERRILEEKLESERKQQELKLEYRRKKQNNIPNIKKVIDKRKITQLLHFTRIENLYSIIEKGLVPVNKQIENSIIAARNDTKRMENHKECTSLSIEFPNYKMLYMLKENNEGTKWVILGLKPELLVSENHKKYFCYTNAASLLPKVELDISLRWSTKFEKMFEDPLVYEDGVEKERSNLIPDNFTTDPQAEILVDGLINNGFIKNVYFNSQNDLNYYIENHNNVKAREINFQINPYLFSSRQDYKLWIKRSKNG